MENFEFIENYLLDRMTPQEKDTFEHRLQQEPELQRDLQELKDMVLAVEYKALKDTLTGFSIPLPMEDAHPEAGEARVVSMTGKPGSEHRQTRMIPVRWLSLAATLVLGALALYFLVDRNEAAANLLVEVFYPDPGLPTVMSETDRYLFYDAMVDYKAENYEVAIEKWSRTTEVGQDTLDYYTGMALLNQGQWQAAEELLNSIPTDSPLKAKADWYRVYTLANQERYNDALQLLESLPATFEGYERVRNYLLQKQ